MHLLQAPFPLGQARPATDDAGVDLSSDVVGHVWEFPFADPNQVGSRALGLKNARKLLARVVKNVSGGTLSPKMAVRYSTTDLKYSFEVAGVANADYQIGCHFVDPFVASVPNGYLFWVVIAGVTIAKTAGTLSNAITAGDRLAVANGGGVQKLVLPGTPTYQDVLDRSHAYVATALESKATTDTNQDILVEVVSWQSR